MATEVKGGGGGGGSGGGEYKPRFCTVCGGEFKNGKALGGHMRVHFPTSKEESNAVAGYKKALKPTHTIKFKKEQEDKHVNINGNQNRAAGTGSVNCLLCSKSFPSMKAIYGHMRCHPERWWRGSRPPPSAAYAGDDDDDDDIDRVDSAGGAGDSLSPLSEVINSISPLVSWPSTIKKGRNGSATGKLSVMEDEEFREGVANLVHLSRAKIGDDDINLNSRSLDETHELLKSRPESKTSNGTALQEFADKCISTCNPNPISVEMSTLDDDDDDDDELGSKITKDLKELNISDDRSDERPPGLTFKINLGNQKRKLTADSDSSPAPPLDMTATSSKKPYRSSMAESSSKEVKMIKCSYCPMSFSTHNGLGGHMSRHRNERNLISSIDQESSTTTSATTSRIKEEIHHPKSPQSQQKNRKETEEIGFGEIDMMGIIVGSQHQCEICKRGFSSGQALGGHKKYHRPTPIIPVAIEENTMMREGAGSSANHRDRFLGIDLNLMPPPEEEEDEVHGGGGGGGGSSSGILQLKLSAF